MKTERRTDLQKSIARKVYTLRKERLWPQVLLAAKLGISQNRLSEIENGQGSFTAEQLITILQLFNVPIDYFDTSTNSAQAALLNALVRFGAKHLGETEGPVPPQAFYDAGNVVREVLYSAASPRQIAALAPVFVDNNGTSIINRLLQSPEAVVFNRVFWLLENILEAIKIELNQKDRPLAPGLVTKYKRAETLIDFVLTSPNMTHYPVQTVDILDQDLISSQSVEEAIENSSSISKKWKVVSRLQVEDFHQALRDAHEIH
jgi:transcriptional regulator with XRE-family HTH domain